ncbi:MAG: PqqD family peptide modification chaperone [Clostridium sp.]|uniref:PqqD family peptide modification chaperone n=1 Tax=Clostridium sp. TaxID=1506 RepID=UPI003F3AFCBD
MSNEELLDMKFKISEKIKFEIDETKSVTILEKQEHKIQKFFRKLKFNIPMYKRTKLDELGSAVFIGIYENKTVREIGENLESQFGEKVQPVYERLLVFINHIYLNLNYIEKVE